MATARLSAGWILGLAALLAGCASTTPPSRPVSAVLEQVSQFGLAKTGEFIERTLKEQETFGYVAPFAPVVLPPEIRRVWVLTHVSADGNLVSGHWVYLRLTDWRWFIETEAVPLRLGAVPAAAPLAPPEPAPPPRPGASRGQERRPGAVTLPWVEGSTRDGETSSPAVGAGLEHGQVPTIQLPPQSPLPAPRGAGTPSLPPPAASPAPPLLGGPTP